MGGLRPKGILDLLTQKQRVLVLDAYRAEWPRFRGDQHNGAIIKSLAKNDVIREVGKGFFELTPTARKAIATHLKLMGETP